MKKFMTLLAMTLTFAMFTPTTVEARDHHRGHSSHRSHSSHRHHHSSHSSHRQHTSHHHHHSSRHYHSGGYYYSGYSAPVYRQQVLVGYDRYGYPVYAWRSYNGGYGCYPRSRGYVSLPGIRIGF